MIVVSVVMRTMGWTGRRDGMDAIKKKIAKLVAENNELVSEEGRLWTCLEEVQHRQSVLSAQIAATSLRRAEVRAQIKKLVAQLEAKEAQLEEIELRLNREADREALNNTYDRFYGRCNHAFYAWKREDKQMRRGCDASRKRHRKQTREACRKAACAEREALAAIAFSLMEEDDE